MNIRKLILKDRKKIEGILNCTDNFNEQEVECAIELVDIYFSEGEEGDYYFYCAVDENDNPVGYVCYGPTPLTEGVYDLYWIVVDPNMYNAGIGTQLTEFVEKKLKKIGARMLLVETSSRSGYETVNKFYLRKGYKQISVIDDFYSIGDHRVTYCKRFD